MLLLIVPVYMYIYIYSCMYIYVCNFSKSLTMPKLIQLNLLRPAASDGNGKNRAGGPKRPSNKEIQQGSSIFEEIAPGLFNF